MLNGIPKIISPELLKVLSEMGHGDEIVIADGNFPSCSINKNVIRADATGCVEMLKAILQLLPLDTYSTDNVVLMQNTKDDPTPVIWKEFDSILKYDEKLKLNKISREAFYERAKKAYAVIATGEEKIYGNIIIKKGVVR